MEVRSRQCAQNVATDGAFGGLLGTGGTHQESSTMKKILAASALAAITGLGFAGAAFADQATASVNVRSGPGTEYRVVDTLYAGEEVNIETCRSNGWCLIEHSGPDGWVSARYLSNEGGDYGNDDDPLASVRRTSRSASRSAAAMASRSASRRAAASATSSVSVTFYNRGDVAGGADADVQRAQVMSRAEAERRDRPNDRQAIYDYGTNQQTRQTCNATSTI